MAALQMTCRAHTRVRRGWAQRLTMSEAKVDKVGAAIGPSSAQPARRCTGPRRRIVRGMTSLESRQPQQTFHQAGQIAFGLRIVRANNPYLGRARDAWDDGHQSAEHDAERIAR